MPTTLLVLAALVALPCLLSACAQSYRYRKPPPPAFTEGTPGRVFGRVTEAPSGETLTRALVTIAGTDDSTCVTDKSGNFTLDPVPPGTFWMEASYPRYRVQQKKVTLHAGGALRVDFRLEAIPVPLIRMD